MFWLCASKADVVVKPAKSRFYYTVFSTKDTIADYDANNSQYWTVQQLIDATMLYQITGFVFKSVMLNHSNKSRTRKRQQSYKRSLNLLLGTER